MKRNTLFVDSIPKKNSKVAVIINFEQALMPMNDPSSFSSSEDYKSLCWSTDGNHDYRENLRPVPAIVSIMKTKNFPTLSSEFINFLRFLVQSAIDNNDVANIAIITNFSRRFIEGMLEYSGMKFDSYKSLIAVAKDKIKILDAGKSNFDLAYDYLDRHIESKTLENLFICDKQGSKEIEAAVKYYYESKKNFSREYFTNKL